RPRHTPSAIYNIRRRDGGFWANTFVWGRNSLHGGITDSFLLESDLNLASRNTVFGRWEYVEKTGEELNLMPMDRRFGIAQYTLGYVYDFTPNRDFQTGLGASVTFSAFPSDLKPVYGDSPVSFWLF